MTAPEYIWIYDSNRRSYVDENGNKTHSPVYRYSWMKHKVTGETTRSWLLEYGQKAPKKPNQWQRDSYAYSEQELEDFIWVNDKALEIAAIVRKADAQTLRKVAEVIGYE